MSDHKPTPRRRFRLWLAINTVVLVGLSGWVVRSTLDVPTIPVPHGALPVAAASGTGTAGQSAAPGTATPVPSKQSVMSAPGYRFGLSAPQVPWSRSEIDGIATKAGAQPTLLQYFVKWTEEFRPEAVEAAYGNGAMPVISWEPWSGLDQGESQPAYALRQITAGKYDAYLTRFATAVRDQRWPIGLRFAHEMNGSWFPWSERQSGNKPGDYVKAWQHVHQVFTRVGANNVIWIWSPNIIRPAPSVNLKALYPGDQYVDWIGMVGYSTSERTAAALYEPTLNKLRAFTKRPLLITETGTEPGDFRVPWIRDLFVWLSRRTDVVGFIWFEFSREQGGKSDWRFTSDPVATATFRAGLGQLRLAPAPR